MKLKVYPNACLARQWFEYDKQDPEVTMSWALRAQLHYVDGTEVLYTYARDPLDVYKLQGQSYESVWYAPGVPQSVVDQIQPLIRPVPCSPSSHSQVV